MDAKHVIYDLTSARQTLNDVDFNHDKNTLTHREIQLLERSIDYLDTVQALIGGKKLDYIYKMKIDDAIRFIANDLPSKFKIAAGDLKDARTELRRARHILRFHAGRDTGYHKLVQEFDKIDHAINANTPLTKPFMMGNERRIIDSIMHLNISNNM